MFRSIFRAACSVRGLRGAACAAMMPALLLALPAQAADGDLAWARAISGSSIEEVHGMCTDDSGYVYTTGTFSGTVDFDPGAGNLPLSSSGFGDIYLQKLDRDGNLLWAIALGASASGDYGMAVAVDSAGMVYLTGFFGSTVDFDPGPGTHELTSNGNQDIFVLKLDSAGNYLWAYAAGAGNSDQGRAIAVDEAGHVYAGGSFRDTVDFDPTAGVLQRTASGSAEGYVVKLDADGTLIWAEAVGTSGGDIIRSLAVDTTGNVFAGGIGTSSALLRKLDYAGDPVATYSYGGTEASGVAVDSAGNLYVTGYFDGTQDFDPGPGTANLTAPATTDVYALKLDSSGNYVWSFGLGATSFGQGTSIALDGAGNVVLAGSIGGTADFDPSGATATRTSAGTDAYAAKYTSGGAFLWAGLLGGTSSDLAYSVAADAQGNAMLTGVYQGAGDYDPGPGTVTLPHAGSSDAFVVKLQGPADTTAPTAHTITPATTGPTNNSSIAFNLKFNEAVQNFDNLADLVIAHSGTASTGATITGGPRVYTVTVTGITGTGSFTLAASTASGLIDLAGNPLAASVTSAPVTIDNTGPAATSIVPTITGPTNAGSVDFTITFDGPALNFNDASDVVLTHTGTASTGITLTGGPSVYTATVTGITGNGSFTLAVNGASDVQDSVGNPLAASVTSAPVTIDNTGPAATSIVPTTTGPTSAGSVDFTITFDGPALNVNDASDVVLTHTGTASTGVSITGGPSVYTATVTGITGNGSFTLAVNGASDVQDSVGNPLASSVTSAPVTIDNTGPAATSIVPTTTGPTSAGSVDFTITFDGPALNVNDASDLLLTHTGTASTGVNITGGPSVYTATVTGITGDGSFTLAVNAASDVQDSAGNPLAASVTSAPVTIDNTGPAATLSTAAPSLVNTGISVTIALTEPTANFESGDWTLTNAAVSAFTGTGDAYTLTLEPQADGPFSISLPAAVFTDAAGNPNTASNVIGREFDGTDPGFTALLVTPNTASPGTEIHITFDASEPLWSAPDVTINGNPADESTAKAGPSYHYTYTIQPTDPTGPAEITITGLDPAGNIGSLTSTAALTILPNDPALPLSGATAAALLLGLLGLRATRRR